MDNKTAKRVHLIYGCITSVLIIALGIGLMLSSWDIYQSGDHPYTRASIGAQLQKLTVLITATACAIIGGFLLHLLIPTERKRTSPIRDEMAAMKKMAKKVGYPEGVPAIRKEETLRIILPIVTGLLYVGLMIYPAIYLFDRTNFPGADPTGEIKQAALVVLPLALAGLLLCYICAALLTGSIKRQTNVYKQILAANGGQGSASAGKPERKFPMKTIRCAVFAVAVIFIVAGILNGSAEDVLTKAIKICTECIGLG